MVRTATAICSAAVLVLLAGCSSDGDAAASTKAYCSAVETLQSAATASGGPSEDSIGATVTSVQAAAKVAPEAVGDDLATVAEGAAKIQAIWAANEYDEAMVAADPAFEEAAQDPDYRAAHERVEAYNKAECGLTYSGGW